MTIFYLPTVFYRIFALLFLFCVCLCSFINCIIHHDFIHFLCVSFPIVTGFPPLRGSREALKPDPDSVYNICFAERVRILTDCRLFSRLIISPGISLIWYPKAVKIANKSDFPKIPRARMSALFSYTTRPCGPLPPELWEGGEVCHPAPANLDTAIQ